MHVWSAIKRYAFAVVAVALTVGFMRELPPGAGPYLVILFLGVVSITAYLNGFGPAVLVTVVELAGLSYLLLAPGYLIPQPHHWPGYATYLAVALTGAALIAHRKSTIRALRTSERRFRLALQNSPVVVTEQDRDLRYRWVYNPPPGIAARDVLGKTDNELSADDEGVRLAALKRRVLETGQGVRESVEVVIGGRRCVLDTTLEPLRGPSGVVEGVMSAATDVTALKDIEQQLRALNESLEHRVAERTAELARSYERLRQSERLAAIGEMVAGLSHESRNALQRSLASLELLQRRLTDRPDLMRYLDEARKAQLDLQQVYEDVKDYAAPVILERRTVSVPELWRLSWENLAVSRGSRDVRLVEEVHTSDPSCTVDPFRMQQVFRNLIENAIDACMDPVEIRLICTEAQQDGQPFLQVSVADNGPGPDHNDTEMIWQPFHTTKTHGTGLGLAIVRRIVEAHGGAIHASKHVDKGFAVEMLLPRNVA